MKMQYFSDTDTLYIEFRSEAIVDAQDLDDFTLIERDATGGVCAITVEQASQRTNLHHFTVEGLVAA